MTASRPDQWMPFYWGDYLRDTMHLRADGHGAYILLIAAYWTGGEPLLDDDEHLMAIARLEPKAWQKLKLTLSNFFTVADGVWRHKRIDAELARTKAISEARSRAGKRGGEASAKTRATMQANSEQLVKQTDQQNPTPLQLQPQEEESDATASPKKKDDTNGSKRGTRLPDGWEPSQDGERFCLSLGVDYRRTLDEFADHWKAKPGQGGVKLDWEATWRNWCRRAGGFELSRIGSGRKPAGIVATANSLMDGKK